MSLSEHRCRGEGGDARRRRGVAGGAKRPGEDRGLQLRAPGVRPVRQRTGGDVTGSRSNRGSRSSTPDALQICRTALGLKSGGRIAPSTVTHIINTLVTNTHARAHAQPAAPHRDTHIECYCAQATAQSPREGQGRGPQAWRRGLRGFVI